MTVESNVYQILQICLGEAYSQAQNVCPHPQELLHLDYYY